MIAYDTNVLIYALEGESEWAAAAQAVDKRGENEGAVLSVLTIQELMTGVVLRGGDADMLEAIVGSLSATEFLPVSREICKRAVELTKKYGRQLYGYDAIHLATALEAGAETFVTNDKMLLKLGFKELRILDLGNL